MNEHKVQLHVWEEKYKLGNIGPWNLAVLEHSGLLPFFMKDSRHT